MEKALNFLKQNNDVAFATCENQYPKIRVFRIMKQEGTTLYFATAARKEVFKQLKTNPNVEILSAKNQISVRCAGKVEFNVDDETQKQIYNENEVLQRLYENYKSLEYFSLKIKYLDYYDLEPNPPILQHFDL